MEGSSEQQGAVGKDDWQADNDLNRVGQWEKVTGQMGVIRKAVVSGERCLAG
jgi:hypothetical protein